MASSLVLRYMYFYMRARVTECYYRLPRIAQKCTATTTIVHIVQIQIVGVNLEARMGQIMGIHGLLLRWLLAPEFLSQGCSKILHSILSRI